jgi:hypothetical protein
MKAWIPYLPGINITMTGMRLSMFSFHATRADLLDIEGNSHSSDARPAISRTSRRLNIDLPGIEADQLYVVSGMSNLHAPQTGYRSIARAILLIHTLRRSPRKNRGRRPQSFRSNCRADT